MTVRDEELPALSTDNGCTAIRRAGGKCGREHDKDWHTEQRKILFPYAPWTIYTVAWRCQTAHSALPKYSLCLTSQEEVVFQKATTMH